MTQKDEPKYEPTEDRPSKEDFEKEYEADPGKYKEKWDPKPTEPTKQ